MNEGLCRERAGFLFKHACSNSALHQCERCGKEICNQHVDLGEDGQQWCISCAKGSQRRAVRHDATATSHQSHRPHYYYGDYWYPGYGAYHVGWGHHHYHHSHHHDRNDFTEGDAAALGDPGDEGFERDLDDS